MGEVHYVIRHGKRIEVETVDFGGLTPVKRKKVEPFAKVPWAAKVKEPRGWGEAPSVEIPNVVVAPRNLARGCQLATHGRTCRVVVHCRTQHHR
jgi:hypothetical protein